MRCSSQRLGMAGHPAHLRQFFAQAAFQLIDRFVNRLYRLIAIDPAMIGYEQAVCIAPNPNKIGRAHV